jgi:hypothetical protein
MGYKNKARLLDDISDIEQYRPILEKDVFKEDEPHWRSLKKNTITLFQVLIDQDLRDLVAVLKSFPIYTQWVCEHFRYAYSYSENSADIDAASELLQLGEVYFSKQFVRNVVRKLPKSDEMDLEELSEFAKYIQESYKNWHPIITNYLCDSLTKTLQKSTMHPLQRIVVLKPIAEIERLTTYEYEAEDRDAVLDIPYMN